MPRKGNRCTTMVNFQLTPLEATALQAVVVHFLPVSVTDLTHDAQDRVVRHALQFTDDLRHEGWSAPDDGLQVPGHLPSQRQQDVRVLAQVLGQGANPRLGGRGLLAAFDLAQIGRLDADARRHLPDRIPRIVLSSGLPHRADVPPEVLHDSE